MIRTPYGLRTFDDKEFEMSASGPKWATLYRMVMPTHVCPYGLKALHLLHSRGYAVDDRWLKTREETDAFKAEHGVKTTPQAFIDGVRVGGYDDLRRHFGLRVAEPSGTSYRPVAALFAMTALMALAASQAAFGSPFTVQAIAWFFAFSMCVLALLKLQDVEKFSTMFLNYDLLARRWVALRHDLSLRRRPGRPADGGRRASLAFGPCRALHRHARRGLRVQGGLYRAARAQVRLRGRIRQRAARFRLAHRKPDDDCDGAVDGIDVMQPTPPLFPSPGAFMRIAYLLAATAILPAAAQAQDMPDMPGMADHQHQAAPAAAPPQPASDLPTSLVDQRPTDQQGSMAGMDHGMAGMDHDAMPGMDHAGMDMHGMQGALGSYSMMRDASGTAWQPDSSPMPAIMGKTGEWSIMVHGFATLIYDDQGGPRGDSKTFSSSMLMGMGQRPLGGGTLTLRGMISLDPLMGKSGYPLLLATGETANGRTELVDRQHPHDAFMEMAAAYSHPLAGSLSGFLYVGLPGEPALGPATYMHRFSGMANPEAPISHHWLDSTHVTFGVATAGLVYRGLKLEGSVFTGREPDEHRWDIERPRMDSWSARITLNPTPNLSMQVSHGFIKSPEQLHPEEDVHRTTASATWNLPLGENRNWQTTAAWGRNDPSGGDHSHRTDAFLLDSALQLGRWTMFGRAENVDKDELFGNESGGDPLAGQVFNVSKLSLGGYHSLPFGKLALDLGGLASKYDLPRDIQPRYGSSPTSFMLFTRLRISG